MIKSNRTNNKHLKFFLFGIFFSMEFFGFGQFLLFFLARFADNFICRHCVLANFSIFSQSKLNKMFFFLHSSTSITCIFHFSSGLTLLRYHLKNGRTDDRQHLKREMIKPIEEHRREDSNIIILSFSLSGQSVGQKRSRMI